MKRDRYNDWSFLKNLGDNRLALLLASPPKYEKEARQWRRLVDRALQGKPLPMEEVLQYLAEADPDCLVWQARQFLTFPNANDFKAFLEEAIAKGLLELTGVSAWAFKTLMTYPAEDTRDWDRVHKHITQLVPDVYNAPNGSYFSQLPLDQRRSLATALCAQGHGEHFWENPEAYGFSWEKDRDALLDLAFATSAQSYKICFEEWKEHLSPEELIDLARICVTGKNAESAIQNLQALGLDQGQYFEVVRLALSLDPRLSSVLDRQSFTDEQWGELAELVFGSDPALFFRYYDIFHLHEDEDKIYQRLIRAASTPCYGLLHLILDSPSCHFCGQAANGHGRNG